MMRFNRRSRVEVWCKHEVPSGSWRCAKIVCSNRYYVTVVYHTRSVDQKIVETVPRNLVRPCPPAVVDGPENWSPGDVIEVLHNFSWKMATVLKTFLKNRYTVRLIGFSDEFMVHKLDTRLRQYGINVEKRNRYLPEKKVKRKRMRMQGMVQCPRRRPEEHNNYSDASSVGSCSIITESNPLKRHPIISGCVFDDDHEHSSYSDDSSSDADFSLQLHNEELAADIHRLELNAYRYTMEALYASGPLSWEQESVITNLRISLHISNDEHLMELRHLNA